MRLHLNLDEQVPRASLPAPCVHPRTRRREPLLIPGGMRTLTSARFTPLPRQVARIAQIDALPMADRAGLRKRKENR